jgi:hypothetical protein
MQALSGLATGNTAELDLKIFHMTSSQPSSMSSSSIGGAKLPSSLLGRRVWKKIEFANGEKSDLADIRSKLTTHTSALTMSLKLYTLGSLGRVEEQLGNQGGELKGIKESIDWIAANMTASKSAAGEGSVWTIYENDDRAFWRELRRELHSDGFPWPALEKRKNLIKAYVKELGNRGVFDEDENEDERIDFETRDAGGHLGKGKQRLETVEDDENADDLEDLKSSKDNCNSSPKTASKAEVHRRRELTPGKSHLRRLDLTVSSITEEEKRARTNSDARGRDGGGSTWKEQPSKRASLFAGGMPKLKDRRVHWIEEAKPLAGEAKAGGDSTWKERPPKGAALFAGGMPKLKKKGAWIEQAELLPREANASGGSPLMPVSEKRKSLVEDSEEEFANREEFDEDQSEGIGFEESSDYDSQENGKQRAATIVDDEEVGDDLGDFKKSKGDEEKCLPECKSFKCPTCLRQFQGDSGLSEHLIAHEYLDNIQPFHCRGACSKSFVRLEVRDKHELVHSGEKAFVCETFMANGKRKGCGRQFARSDVLLAHLRSDTGRVCGRVCSGGMGQGEILVLRKLYGKTDEEKEDDSGSGNSKNVEASENSESEPELPDEQNSDIYSGSSSSSSDSESDSEALSKTTPNALDSETSKVNSKLKAPPTTQQLEIAIKQADEVRVAEHEKAVEKAVKKGDEERSAISRRSIDLIKKRAQ